MTQHENHAIIVALEIIGREGRVAADYIKLSLENGRLDRVLFGEAQAQIEGINADDH